MHHRGPRVSAVPASTCSSSLPHHKPCPLKPAPSPLHPPVQPTCGLAGLTFCFSVHWPPCLKGASPSAALQSPLPLGHHACPCPSLPSSAPASLSPEHGLIPTELSPMQPRQRGQDHPVSLGGGFRANRSLVVSIDTCTTAAQYHVTTRDAQVAAWPTPAKASAVWWPTALAVQELVPLNSGTEPDMALGKLLLSPRPRDNVGLCPGRGQPAHTMSRPTWTLWPESSSRPPSEAPPVPTTCSQCRMVAQSSKATGAGEPGTSLPRACSEALK